MKVCVIIPTYNEEKEIAGLIEKIKALGLEMIIIDDGSKDKTATIAMAKDVKVLRNSVNSGKGASLIKGYSNALSSGFDAVISMDGDGQHCPSDIGLFLEKAGDPSCAVVIGNRMSETKKMPVLRLFTNHIMSGLISLITRQKIPDTQCGFRLIKKEVLERLDFSTYKYETESEILIKASRLGFKIESVPVKTIYSGQKSQINPLVDTLRFLRFIIPEFFRSLKHA